MSGQYIDEQMVEMFVYEAEQILEKLEQVIMDSERNNEFSEESINEIFRSMHTIKGSSAMMAFNGMSALAHKIEDIFFVIRENSGTRYDFPLLVDLVLESIDFFKVELLKIKNSEALDAESNELTEKFIKYLTNIKDDKGTTDIIEPKKKEIYKYDIKINEKDDYTKKYKATVYFGKGCEMENIRAYAIVHNIVECAEEVYYSPKNIIEDEQTAEIIRNKGFKIVIKSQSKAKVIKAFLNKTIFLEQLEFEEIVNKEYHNLAAKYFDSESDDEEKTPTPSEKDKLKVKRQQEGGSSKQQSIISVNVDKLDRLMDMVGELVISEAMVTQNPEITNLEIESFNKSSRQLHKITGELQDLVMAIRMVPLSKTFLKMHRIVRDMSKQLNKKIILNLIGEETEVDKNIIEKISDPLMHIIRNSMDHGIEDEATRLKLGKNSKGNIKLEAKNAGSDVLVIIRDDGKGLDRKALYQKAKKQGIVNREQSEMSDQEILNLVLTPGFSTKEVVTEFSGRGVGMDVVAKNIASIGGTVIVDSIEGSGTTITLKIPLTLAIIEGMNIRVGKSRFTVPIVAIQESFRVENSAVIQDTEGNEMIMVRGLCYPVLRLHEFYSIDTDIEKFDEGILIMVEEDGKSCCIFADELLGQQQVVVKSLPDLIKRYNKIKGLGGCTLLGDGSISLILDVGELELSNVKT